MYRDRLEKLKEWKCRKDRLPLILRGARQVGKTWLAEEFGRLEFRNTVRINFEKSPSVSRLFDGDIDPQKIIHFLEVFSGETISPETTLIFFDEIQECPRALTSLKYFAEDAPEYAVIAAGSILGIAEHKGLSFPVGKVSYMDLYPMSFTEFLIAMNESQLAELIANAEFESLGLFHEKLEGYLREYMIVGGMPAAVSAWQENRSLTEVRTKQEEILESYLMDLSKHAPSDIAVKARQIISSITSQLAKENKKFIYAHVREGARAKEYEKCFAWLESCRIINIVNRVTVPAVPIKAYQDPTIFKLFMHDTGLLSALSQIDPRIIIDGSSVYDVFKGALTEQYVLQELISSGWDNLCYYSNDRSTAEIDFILESRENIIPLEVKPEINLKAKSLKAYHDKYAPKLSLRASLMPYKEQDWLINVPLYAVSAIRRIAKKNEGTA